MNPPSVIRVAQAAIVLNAILWFAFAAVTALGLHPSYRDPGLLRWAMAALAALTAVVLSFLARSLGRHSRIAYWLSVAFLTALVLAGLLDELGWADLLFLVLASTPIILLLRSRRWYLENAPRPHYQRIS